MRTHGDIILEMTEKECVKGR